MLPSAKIDRAGFLVYDLRRFETVEVDGQPEAVGVLEFKRMDTEHRREALGLVAWKPKQAATFYRLDEAGKALLGYAGRGLVRLDPFCTTVFEGVHGRRSHPLITIKDDSVVHACTRYDPNLPNGPMFTHHTVTFRDRRDPWLLRERMDELNALLGGNAFYMQAINRWDEATKENVWRYFLHMREFGPSTLMLTAMFVRQPVCLPRKGQISLDDVR